jgi:hypothetical protein
LEQSAQAPESGWQLDAKSRPDFAVFDLRRGAHQNALVPHLVPSIGIILT